MKQILCKRKSFSLTLLLAFMITSVASPLATADDERHQDDPLHITINYEPVHNPPRALGRGTAINWEKPGLTLELLRLVEKRLGIKISYKRLPWKRGLYLLERNEVDGIFHASFKAERETLGSYPKIDGKPDKSRAIFNQSYVLYKLKTSPVQYDGNEFINVDGPIGAVSDYSIISNLRKKGLEVDDSPTLKQNFDKLNRRKIVAFASLENMSDDFLARNSYRYLNIVKVEPALKSKPYYLLFSHHMMKEHGDVSEQIWNAIAEIKNSNEFKAISTTY